MNLVKRSSIKQCGIVMSIILVTLFQPIFAIKPVKEWGIMEGMVAAGAAVVGCVGGFAAVQAIGNWWDPSVETLIQKTDELKTRGLPYNQLMTIIKTDYNIDTTPLSCCGWINHKLNEPALYDASCTVWKANEKQDYFFRKLDWYIEEVQKHAQTLIAKAKKLKRENAYELRSDIYTLESLAAQLMEYVQELKVLQQYINTHISYFQLAEREFRIYRDYAKEFRLLEEFAYDPYRLQHELDRVSQHQYKAYSYPCVEYVEQLEREIKSLRKKRLSARFAYTDRFAWTDKAIVQLEQIRYILDSLYRQQLAAREQYHLEQQKVKQVNAQIREMKRLNDLHESAYSIPDRTDTIMFEVRCN